MSEWIRALAENKICSSYKHRTAIRYSQFIESLYILMKGLFFMICEGVRVTIFDIYLIVAISELMIGHIEFSSQMSKIRLCFWRNTC